MISSMFFAKNKSSRSMELFITSYMPFGTLIKTKSDQDVLLSSKLYPKDTVISIRLTESLSTSFQSDELKAPDNETIFGTLTLNYIDTKHKSSSKSDIVLTIENLHSCSLTLPTNCCTVANESTIIYDINNRNQYNLNIIHYKTNNNKQQNTFIQQDVVDGQIVNIEPNDYTDDDDDDDDEIDLGNDFFSYRFDDTKFIENPEALNEENFSANFL